MVCGNTARHHVEASVREGQLLGGRDDVGPHARRRVDRDHRAALLAEAPRHVAPAGGDVEHLHVMARLAPLDEEVEVRPFAVRRTLAKRVRAL